MPGPRPRKKIAILACMDARLDPLAALGLEVGDAHVIRNAGGVVTNDAVRSLAISQHLLGTERIVLIHHTDCGMLKITDEEFERRMADATGQWPEWRAHAFSDLEASLRESIARLERSPFIPHKDVTGHVFDVATGELLALG